MSDICSTRLQEQFPSSKFELLDEPPAYFAECRRGGSCSPGRVCDVCSTDVKGAVFHCKEKEIDVHPKCAALEKTIRVGDVAFDLRRGGKSESRCLWCNRENHRGSHSEVKGSRYVSRCGKVNLHVFCLIDMEKSVATPVKRKRKRSVDDEVLKKFLTIVLSVLFGDPTAIVASVFLQLLPV